MLLGHTPPSAHPHLRHETLYYELLCGLWSRDFCGGCASPKALLVDDVQNQLDPAGHDQSKETTAGPILAPTS